MEHTSHPSTTVKECALPSLGEDSSSALIERNKHSCSSPRIEDYEAPNIRPHSHPRSLVLPNLSLLYSPFLPPPLSIRLPSLPLSPSSSCSLTSSVRQPGRRQAGRSPSRTRQLQPPAAGTGRETATQNTSYSTLIRTTCAEVHIMMVLYSALPTSPFLLPSLTSSMSR